MKILWIDLNSSYAHSSLALPALHAQIAKNNSVKWEIVSATINENAGNIPAPTRHHCRNDMVVQPRTTVAHHSEIKSIASQ